VPSLPIAISKRQATLLLPDLGANVSKWAYVEPVKRKTCFGARTLTARELVAKRKQREPSAASGLTSSDNPDTELLEIGGSSLTAETPSAGPPTPAIDDGTSPSLVPSQPVKRATKPSRPFRFSQILPAPGSPDPPGPRRTPTGQSPRRPSSPVFGDTQGFNLTEMSESCLTTGVPSNSATLSAPGNCSGTRKEYRWECPGSAEREAISSFGVRGPVRTYSRKKATQVQVPRA